MTVQHTTAGEVDIRLTYGIGGSCGARFSREALDGISVRDLVQRVIRSPQPPGPAARTADVLAEVLAGTREIDVELSNASMGEASGQPISLDHVLVRERNGSGQRDVPMAPEQEDFTIRISESYQGGNPWRFEQHDDGDR